MFSAGTVRAIINELLEAMPGSMVAGGYPVHLALGVPYGDIDFFVPSSAMGALLNASRILEGTLRSTSIPDRYPESWIRATYQCATLKLNIIVVDVASLTTETLYDNFDLDICKMSYTIRGLQMSQEAREVITSGLMVVSEMNPRVRKYRDRLRGRIQVEVAQ